MSTLWMGKEFLEQQNLLYTAGGIVNWNNHLEKHLPHLVTLKKHRPYDLISFLDIHTNSKKHTTQEDVHSTAVQDSKMLERIQNHKKRA